MFCSTKPENDILFGYTGAGEVKRLFFMPLLNVYNFFSIYANIDEWTPDQAPGSLSELDRWILSRLNSMLTKVKENLDDYNVYHPTREIESFVDDLSKWYVRRSRRRFWKSEADEDKRAAYSTLYACLKRLTLAMAPITPFLAEALYQRLVRGAEPDAPESVHLHPWPEADPSLIDEDLMERMDLAVRVSSLGRAARSKSGIKLRQPLQEAVVVGEGSELEQLEGLTWLVKDELNVKGVRLSQERGKLQRYDPRPVLSLLGKKHGRETQKIADAIRGLGRGEATRLLRGSSVTVEIGGAAVEVLSDEVEVGLVPVEGYSVMEEPGLTVGVTTEITEELAREGLARDVVRRIQALRKEADFEIDDLIETHYCGDPEVEAVFEAEGEYIAAETLSRRLHQGAPPEGAHVGEFEIDGLKLRVGLVRL